MDTESFDSSPPIRHRVRVESSPALQLFLVAATESIVLSADESLVARFFCACRPRDGSRALRA
jgi:hypothetical protein